MILRQFSLTALTALLALLTLFGAFRWRVYAVERQNEKLEALVRERTRELAGQFGY